MTEILSLKSISTKLERIAQMAKMMPGVPLTTLAHHIDIEWLREAYRRTRKDAAVGVDGQTAAEYEANLEANLKSLLDRAKSADHYRAPPVRRVHIPKGDGKKTRPIGIPKLHSNCTWFQFALGKCRDHPSVSPVAGTTVLGSEDTQGGWG
jgi:hypothetical protein